MDILNKINKRLEDNSKNFMLSVIYFACILLNWIFLKLIWKINLFQNNTLNILIGFSLFLIIFFSTLNFIIKTITWINLKPTLTDQQLKKKIKKLKKLTQEKNKEKSKRRISAIEKEGNKIAEEIKNHKLKNDNFVQFLFFSAIVISTEYAPFFWTWKIIFQATKIEIKYLLTCKKEKPYFAWGKSLDKNKKDVFYTCYI